MKALTASITTLAALLTLCPLTLANTESQPQALPTSIGEYNIIDKDAHSEQSKAALSQHIGKTIFIKGQLIKIHDGGFGISPNETSDIRISIDPVKRPKYGELLSGKWTSNNRRRKKLDRLIDSCEIGDTVELRGKLCHVTSTPNANVSASTGYPQIPDSHFFFSVNDVTILSNGSPMQFKLGTSDTGSSIK